MKKKYFFKSNTPFLLPPASSLLKGTQNTKILKSYLPVIGWSAVILLLSTRATISLPESWWDLFAPDKFGHAFVYGIQTWLLLKAFRGKLIKKPILWALIISISYGILMEVIQYAFFPNRFFEVFDIIANISGSFIGLFIFKNYFNN